MTNRKTYKSYMTLYGCQEFCRIVKLQYSEFKSTINLNRTKLHQVLKTKTKAFPEFKKRRIRTNIEHYALNTQSKAFE